MVKRILTGDRPTGKLHLGHYIGSLKNRVNLQKEYDQYIMIADMQALTDNFESPSKITNMLTEVAKDYLSVGIDPNDSTIFIQSQISELTELSAYYLNLVTLSRLQRNPTVKSEMIQKAYQASVPMGFLCYPVSQAADITLFKGEIVPVGDDQLPMIEQTNEIVRRFNLLYNTDCLKEAKPLLSNTPRLVGIDGKAKASKSLNNAIYLSDSYEELSKKIFSMYTDPNHIKISDPGQIEGNVVFAYLDAFHDDKEELHSLKEHYKKGGLGDMTIKKILLKSLQILLTPILEKRNNLQDKQIMAMLMDGTSKAKKIATETMQEVRHVIGVDYFNSNNKH